MQTMREEHQGEVMLLTAYHAEACQLLEAATGKSPSPPGALGKGSAMSSLRQEIEQEIRRERAKHRLVTGKLQAEVSEGKKQIRVHESSLLQLEADLEVK